jgi:hypothetical protein
MFLAPCALPLTSVVESMTPQQKKDLIVFQIIRHPAVLSIHIHSYFLPFLGHSTWSSIRKHILVVVWETACHQLCYFLDSATLFCTMRDLEVC